MVGGSRRHVGKTTLICEIIAAHQAKYSITGLKVTSVRAGDEFLHGDHPFKMKDNFEIFEETDRMGQKDTSRMLQAGAQKVFYIRTKDEYVPEAFDHFRKLSGENNLIVCESISLRKYVRPGLFILLDTAIDQPRKSGFIEMKHLADLVIKVEWNQLAEFSGRFYIHKNQWKLKRE